MLRCYMLISDFDSLKNYTVVLVAQKHNFYLHMKVHNWENVLDENGFIFDMKGIVPKELNSIRIWFIIMISFLIYRFPNIH